MQQEIWQEGTRIVIDIDNRRINVTSVGDFNVTTAVRIREHLFRIFEGPVPYFDIVVDIRLQGKSLPGTRRVWKQIKAHPKVRFVAVCGVVSVAKVIHTLLIGFRKHPKLRLFVNKKEAFTWLEGLVENIRSWFDANKGELPSGDQEIVMAVDGANYIGHFDKNKKLFRVDDDPQNMSFSISSHKIMWKPYKRPKGRVEQFTL